MAMRNFWMTANVDGRATDVTAGPRSKDGQMTISLAQRNKGASEKVVEIVCRPDRNGTEIHTEVYVKGILVSCYTTER